MPSLPCSGADGTIGTPRSTASNCLIREHNGHPPPAARRTTIGSCSNSSRSVDRSVVEAALRGAEVHPTLVAEIAARRLSPVDLVDECLARIRTPGTQAACFRFGQRHQCPARRRSSGQGDPRRPCRRTAHGIPIAIKDFVEIEGEVAMGGPRHGAIASRLSRVRPIAARRSVSGLATTQTAFVRHAGLNVRDLSASSPAFAISPASHRGREYRSAFRSR